MKDKMNQKAFTQLILLIAMICSFNLSGQYSFPQAEMVPQNPEFAWLNKVYEPGVSMADGQVQMSSETQELIKNRALRNRIYPEIYTWKSAMELIQEKELKRSFWYLINLYNDSHENKENVLKVLLMYNKIFNMSEILVNTFYTYCFTDPKISTISENIFKIERPDILEEKLESLSQLLALIENK